MKIETNLPQIHLSANDGDKEDATEIVLHKMGNGELFVEWYTRKELNSIILRDQATFSKDVLNALRHFINNSKTY